MKMRLFHGHAAAAKAHQQTGWRWWGEKVIVANGMFYGDYEFVEDTE